MSRLDPHKCPPAYPAPDTSPEAATRRRRGQAVASLRRKQNNPLTRTRFNLYSLRGHIYLVFAACVGAVVVAGVVGPVFGGRVRGWNNWLPVVSFLVLIGAMGAVLTLTYRQHRRLWRLAHNRCPRCGYDLRESHDACPECGDRS